MKNPPKKAERVKSHIERRIRLEFVKFLESSRSKIKIMELEQKIQEIDHDNEGCKSTLLSEL